METLIVSAGKRSRTVIVDTWISKSITAPTQAYKGVQSLTHFQSTKKFSDNQDSRAEALVASSTTQVRFATDRGCRVVAGRWVSAFTGNVIQNTSNIDVDHLVPLAWSWDRGANKWPDEKRLRFANDPVNLLSVEASLNRSKGAKGPDEWLPPAGQCSYVARFIRVVKLYGLKPSSRELEWFQAFLEECRR